MLFIRVQVGGVGPAYEEVVGEGLSCYFFTEFLKKVVIFETHDESSIRGKVHNGRDIVD